MPLKTQQDDQPMLNLTPMIDVVFLLIIFFMVGTKFTELERKVRLQVPAVATGQSLAPAPEKRVVNVYQDGQLTLDRQPVTLDELGRRLSTAQQQSRDLSVLIRGDAAGTFQRVAEVLTTCRQSGVSELGISVRVAARGG